MTTSDIIFCSIFGFCGFIVLLLILVELVSSVIDWLDIGDDIRQAIRNWILGR